MTDGGGGEEGVVGAHLSASDFAHDFVVVLDAPGDHELVIVPPLLAAFLVGVGVDARDRVLLLLLLTGSGAAGRHRAGWSRT